MKGLPRPEPKRAMDHLHAQYDQSSGTPDIRSHTISGRPSSAGCYTPWREATGLTCSPSQRDGADGLPKSTTSSVLCLRLSLPNYHADAAELDVPPQDYPDYAPLDELPESKPSTANPRSLTRARNFPAAHTPFRSSEPCQHLKAERS